MGAEPVTLLLQLPTETVKCLLYVFDGTSLKRGGGGADGGAHHHVVERAGSFWGRTLYVRGWNRIPVMSAPSTNPLKENVLYKKTRELEEANSLVLVIWMKMLVLIEETLDFL